MKVVTAEYLDEHRTESGAWTGAQIRALGIKWPPKAGWREKLIGSTISLHQSQRFEAGKNKFSKKTVRKAQKLLKRLSEPEATLPPPSFMAKQAAIMAEANAQKRALKAAKVADLEAKLERGRINPQWSSQSVASDDFLSSYAWRRVRMEALKRDGRRCLCCGTSPEHGAVMHVDHIKPRRLFPHLALDVDNLQVLCAECNHGKGNWDQTDWREPQIDPELREHLKSIMSD